LLRASKAILVTPPSNFYTFAGEGPDYLADLRASSYSPASPLALIGMIGSIANGVY